MATAPLRIAPPAGTELLRLSTGVFFIGGFLTSVVSLLVPQLRLTLDLSYAEALTVQFAFYASYLLFALPITLGVIALGYMRSIALGLAIMAIACLALTAAQARLDFALILFALLLLSAGITVLQIGSNAVVALIGRSADGAASRLTLLQAFNSLGTVLGPLLCASLLLGGTAASGKQAGAGWAALPFVGSAFVLAALALLFFGKRSIIDGQQAPARPALTELSMVLSSHRLRAGVAAIFAYVGAEVTVGALLTEYLLLSGLGFTPAGAGRAVSLYWGGAMVGRFAGVLLMRRVSPADLLTVAGSGAVLLVLAASASPSGAGAVALILVGLCNSVMYPTIYALALPRTARQAPLGSMVLCMAVVGGAVIPLLTGFTADRIGLAHALVLPALCYGAIIVFGRSCRDAPEVVER